MRPGVRSVQVDSRANSAFALFWLISRGSKTHLLLVPVSKVAFQKHVANLGLEARIGGAPVSQFGTESLGDVNRRGF